MHVPVFREEIYRSQKIKRAWLVETRVDGKQPDGGWGWGRCDLRLYKWWEATQINIDVAPNTNSFFKGFFYSNLNILWFVFCPLHIINTYTNN